MWPGRLLVRVLTEKSWLIVTPDGDLYPEKVVNCDGETGPSAIRRLVPERGAGTARDLPPGCVRVHRFASVSRGEPEKDAWKHEAGRIAAERGEEEFMSGRTRDLHVRVRDQSVPLDENEGHPTCELSVREAGVARVSAESFRTADGSLVFDVGDMLQDPRVVFLGDRAVVELEPGVNILAYFNRHQGTELRARRVDEGHPGGQNLRVRLGNGRNITRASRDGKVDRAAGLDGDLMTDRRKAPGEREEEASEDDARRFMLYDSHEETS